MSDTSNSYPTSLNTFDAARATAYLVTAANWNALVAAVNAIEAKLGIGSDTAAADELFKGTGAGASAWAKLVNANVDAAAAIDASKLASYANTTWTPVLAGTSTAGTQTYSAQVGNYLRIGPLVLATFYVQLTAKDAATAGDIYVSLPVTVRNTSNLFFLGATQFGNITLSAGCTQLTARADSNTTRALLLQGGSGVASIALPASGIGATSQALGTVAYLAA